MDFDAPTLGGAVKVVFLPYVQLKLSKVMSLPCDLFDAVFKQLFDDCL